MTTLEGIGPKRALPLVRRYGDIEGTLAAYGKHRARVESGDFDYVAARAISTSLFTMLRSACAGLTN